MRGHSTEYRQEEKSNKYNDRSYGQRQVPPKEAQSNYHPTVHSTARMHVGKVSNPSCDTLSKTNSSLLRPQASVAVV